MSTTRRTSAGNKPRAPKTVAPQYPTVPTNERVVGEDQLSHDEQRFYMEMCTAVQLADHFSRVAQAAVRNAAHISQEFWLMIRKNHSLRDGATGFRLDDARLAVLLIHREGVPNQTFVLQPDTESNVVFKKPENEKK
jgi:hypothetical protein